jgi:tRNA pseudouridine38-40 synthase
MTEFDLATAAAPEAAAVVSRVAACVEYKGTAYRGWQRQQSGVPSVQEAVEKALGRVANHPVQVFCAGRTDAGVHASCQVIHFDSDAHRSPRNWIHGANANLPADISLSWVTPIGLDFHARFSAVARRYRYVIYNDPIRPAHLAHEVTWNYRPPGRWLVRMTLRPTVRLAVRPSRQSRLSITLNCWSSAVLSCWISVPMPFCTIWCAILPGS